MGDPSLYPGADVLIEQECMRMRGPLGLQGRLTLTEDGLRFVTTGIDRLMDDELWELSLDDIDSVALDATPELAITTVKGDIHRFTGIGAQRVHVRLEALRSERDGGMRARLSFVPGEQVLVQGTVSLLIKGQRPAMGELAITSQRLRFQKGKRLEWAETADLELTLGKLDKIARTPNRPVLDVEAEGKSYRFTGPFAVSAYAWLVATVGHEPALGQLPAAVIADGHAQLGGGLMSTPGELVVSTRRIVFVISRLLEPLMGVADVVVDLEDVEQLELRPPREGGDGRLTIRTRERELSWETALGDEQLDTLVDALCAIEPRDPPDPEAIVDAWGLSLGAGEHLHLAQPILHWYGERSMRRAWLLVTSEHALVLPGAERTAGSDALVFEAERLEHATRHESGDVLIELEDGPLRVSAVGAPLDLEAPPDVSEPAPDDVERVREQLEARAEGAPTPVEAPEADLRGAELMSADLVCADLKSARLDFALLAGALLVKAELRGASLRGADLNGADLTGADLRDAVLSGARVEGASFADADLRGADLAGLLGEPSSLAGARIDHASAARTGLSDIELIQLFGAGAELVDLERFSEGVQRACGAVPDMPAVELDPSPRRLVELELQSRRVLADRMSQPPPAPGQVSLLPALSWLEEVAVDDQQRQLVRFSSMPPPMSEDPATSPPISHPPPMSLRSMRLVASVAPAAALEAEWEEGDVVLGVTLQRKLPRGNIAVTWLGVDDAGDEMVVKIFDAARHGFGLMASAFRRGVRVMNRLADEGAPPDGIASLHAVSVNRLAFAMPYAPIGTAVDLPTLRWSPDKLVGFFQQLCKAVASAHGRGVLHRCLRPENILLGDDFEPILTDFDLLDLPTLAAEDDGAGGYRAFVAPEELLGEGTQSPSADIYSLGRVLHYLMSGEVPKEHIQDVPLLQSLEGQPEGLVRIIRKCTVRNPAARYQQVSDLLDDLARHVTEPTAVGISSEAMAPVIGLRPGRLPEQRRWLSGRPKPAAAKRPAPRPGARRPTHVGDAALLTRRARMRVGAVGVLLFIAALVSMIPVPVPSTMHLEVLRWVAAVAGGLMSFFLPRVERRPILGRVGFAGFALLLVFIANPSRLSVFRLEAALEEGDVAVRAEAVRVLVDMGEMSFDGLNLAEIDLRGAYLSNRSFRGTDLAGANLTAAVLYRANFENANLAGACLDSAAAVESGFDGADLTGALIRRANLRSSTASLATGWRSAVCDDFTKFPQGWSCVGRRPAHD